MRPGDTISFEAGSLNAVVLDTEQDQIKVQFQQAGYLRPGGKSLFIPGNRLAQLPILQADDKNDIINIAVKNNFDFIMVPNVCLLYTSPSPRDRTRSRMPSSA